MSPSPETPVLRVPCPAEISAPNAARFRDDVRGAVTTRHHRLELDMSKTTFIDSSGLGALISIHKLLCSHGGMLCILNPTSPVLQILELTRMNRLFEIQSAPHAGH